MKKFLSLVLALVMTMSLVTVSAGAKDFTDSTKIQYAEAVDVMSAVKVIDGYAEGDFRPSTTLTRGAAAKIICNLILGPTTASALVADAAPYKDVPTNHTFAGYIAYCQKTGIISGYADGTFKPANSLTGYAFMKMLLGALGYKADQEGYTGANWSINVAKRALNIGLADDLVGDFNGVKAVNREEACLYAFNTLKATMVEYDKNSTVIVGNITIKEQSDAKEMANTGKTDGNIDKDGKMQFAEKYFTDLKGVATTDEFSRPATMWKVKSEEIGTYTDTADATYTKKVEIGDIYKDLGLGKSISAKKVSVYVDGVEDASQPARDITKGDDKNKYGDNGVLTEVFYDNDNDSVVITEVNTYVGTITKTVKATDKKDAYVVVAPESEKPANFKNEFETDDKFEDDDYVLYTYSEDAKEIKSVEVAKSVSGEATRIENKAKVWDANKAIYIENTAYKFSNKADGVKLDDASVGNEYDVYLDAYGYAIYVEEVEEIGNYALLVDYQNKTNFNSNKAMIVFADGTEKQITVAQLWVTNAYQDMGTSVAAQENTLYTFTTKSNGEYKLKAIDTSKYDATMSTITKVDDGKATGTIDSQTGKTMRFADTAAIFVVPGNGDDAKVITGKALGTWKSITSITGASSYLYGKKDGGIVYANLGVIVMGNQSAAPSSGDVQYGFVTADSAVVKEGDDYYVSMTIWNGTSEVTVKADSYYEYNGSAFTAKTDVDEDTNVKNYTSSGTSYTVAFAKQTPISYKTTGDGVISEVRPLNVAPTSSEYLGAVAVTGYQDGKKYVSINGTDYDLTSDTVQMFVDTDAKKGSTSGSITEANEVHGYFVKNAYVVLNTAKDEVEFILVDTQNNLNINTTEGDISVTTTTNVTAVDNDKMTLTIATGNVNDTVATWVKNATTGEAEVVVKGTADNNTKIQSGDHIYIIAGNGDIVDYTVK